MTEKTFNIKGNKVNSYTTAVMDFIPAEARQCYDILLFV